MNSENMQPQASAATLTEKELFRQFLKMHIQHWTNFGALSHNYTPEELLRDSGEWDFTTEFAERFTDALEDEENPGDGIRTMISDFEIYLENARLILSDFESLKAMRLVMPEEPDGADREAYAAWELAANAAEDTPRYRPSMNASEAQEAA